jgi:hypothetical protein
MKASASDSRLTTAASATRTLVCLLAWLSTSADAEIPAPSPLFVQPGIADGAHSMVFGAVWGWLWGWRWRRPFAGGTLTGYSELAFGRWRSRDDGAGDSRGSATAWTTQLGITPVLRWHPSTPEAAWFLEAGVGANLLTPVYVNGDKRFSTTFNFGDHMAVGWGWGEERRHEIVLRVQHFSNAGIEIPNPGEDFVQLRYAWQY